MTIRRVALTTSVLCALTALGCRDEPSPTLEMAGITITDAYAPAQPTRDVGALYFTITNANTESDTLKRVTTDVAARAEIHRLAMVERRIQMTPVGRIVLHPGGTVRLKPGSSHVMLFGLGRQLTEGDSVHVTAVFSGAGPVRFPALVLPYAEVARRLQDPDPSR